MKAIKILIIVFSCIIFLISCKNTYFPDQRGILKGSGGGQIVGKDYKLPEGSLSQLEQKKDFDPNMNTITLFKLGDYGSKFFRIPALICTSNGVILAAADRRYDNPADLGKGKTRTDVLVRRSKDLGATWSEPITIGNVASDLSVNHIDSYGDAFFINCHNGDVLCGVITEPGTASKNPRGKTIIYRSSDDGLTWEKKITILPKDIPNCDRGWGASGQGLTLRYGDNAGKKRLMFAFYQFMNNNQGDGIRAMVSEDDGISFKAYGLSENNGILDETKAIELSSGRIMFNSRIKVGKGGQRRWVISSDVGKNWTVQGQDPEVDDPGNNADFSRFDYNGRYIKTPKYILMINSNVKHNGKWFFTRKNHTIRLTINDFNDGNGTSTGKYDYTKRLVIGGEKLYSGYPTITVLPDGTIATLTEETWETTRDPKVTGDAGGDDYNIVFRRFNLHWLTDGKEYVDYSSDNLFQYKNY